MKTATKSITLQSVHPSYFIAVLSNYQELETILITSDKNLKKKENKFSD